MRPYPRFWCSRVAFFCLSKHSEVTAISLNWSAGREWAISSSKLHLKLRIGRIFVEYPDFRHVIADFAHRRPFRMKEDVEFGPFTNFQLRICIFRQAPPSFASIFAAWNFSLFSWFTAHFSFRLILKPARLVKEKKKPSVSMSTVAFKLKIFTVHHQRFETKTSVCKFEKKTLHFATVRESWKS